MSSFSLTNWIIFASIMFLWGYPTSKLVRHFGGGIVLTILAYLPPLTLITLWIVANRIDEK